MIYLSGVTSDADESTLIAAGIGLMCQRGNSYHLRADRYPFCAIDIGMAASDADPYLDYLDRFPHRDRCLFAVSPDAYPDAVESQRRGLEYAPIIRALGYPAAIVAQDGAEHLDWPWDDLDCLFVGGKRTPNPADEWKLSTAAESLVRRARAHGKWVHMGRVNNGDGVGSRLERARAMGCLSADGTKLKYLRRRKGGDPRGAAVLSDWHAWLDANQPLNLSPLETPTLPVHRAAAAAIATRTR